MEQIAEAFLTFIVVATKSMFTGWQKWIIVTAAMLIIISIVTVWTGYQEAQDIVTEHNNKWHEMVTNGPEPLVVR